MFDGPDGRSTDIAGVMGNAQTPLLQFPNFYFFTSVMFDGSKLSYAENLAETKAIVRAAHAVGVRVEAEDAAGQPPAGAPSTRHAPAGSVTRRYWRPFTCTSIRASVRETAPPPTRARTPSI